MDNKEHAKGQFSLSCSNQICVKGEKSVDDNEFEEYLSELEAQFRRNITQFAGNEYNVRTLLIEPILDKFGWTAPLYRHSEVVCKKDDKRGGRADFTLDINGDCKIVIEAKSIDVKLEEQDEQLIDYIEKTHKFKTSVVAGILTNGYEWRIYRYKDNHFERIIRTDISQHEHFVVVKDLLQKDYSIKDKIFAFSNPIKYNSEEFYQPNPRVNFKIIDGNGCAINGKNNVERLHNFIIRFKDNVLELSRQGYFDKIIITEKGENFQRLIGTQYLQIDHDKYYITREYGTDFKYLVIKQIICCLELDKEGWKVEYE